MKVELVWLKDAFGPVIHSPGLKATKKLWATKCGLPIQTARELRSELFGYVDKRGVLINRDLLNPVKISECGNCFRKRYI